MSKTDTHFRYKKFLGNMSLWCALAACTSIPKAFGSVFSSVTVGGGVSTYQISVGSVSISADGRGGMEVTGGGPDTQVVDRIIDGGRIQLVLERKFLMAPVIPQGIGIFHGGSLKAGYSGFSTIIGGVVSGPTEDYTIRFLDGTSANLWDFAKSTDEIEALAREWDTSEAGFVKHIEDLNSVSDELRSVLVGKWTGTKVLDVERFLAVLNTAKRFSDRLAIALTLLKNHAIADEAVEDREVLCELIVTEDRPELSTREKLRILSAAGLVTAEDRLGALQTLGAHEAREILQEVPADEISSLDSAARWQLFKKLSEGSGDSKLVETVGTLLKDAELESAQVLSLINRVEVSHKADMIKALGKAPLEGLTSEDLGSLLLRVNVSYRVKVIKCLADSGVRIPQQVALAVFQSTEDSYKCEVVEVLGSEAFAGIEASDLQRMMTSVGVSYRAELIQTLRSLQVVIPRRVARNVFQHTSDSYKREVIEAGLFDGSELTLGHATELGRGVSSSYKGEVLQALESRYVTCRAAAAPADWS